MLRPSVEPTSPHPPIRHFRESELEPRNLTPNSATFDVHWEQMFHVKHPATPLARGRPRAELQIPHLCALCLPHLRHNEAERGHSHDRRKAEC